MNTTQPNPQRPSLDPERISLVESAEGCMYVDRTNKAGSQKQLAFLTYKTMELVIEKDCPSDLAEQIKEDAAFPQGLKEMDDHLKALTMGRILDCNTVTREGPNLILS